MKKYLESKGISIKQLSNITGIPYSTLNDIINGKTSIDNIRFKYVKKMAAVFEMSIDEFNTMFSNENTVSEKVPYDIIVKNKSYYLICEFTENPHYLCKVNQINSKYKKEIASWEYDALKRKEELNNWKTNLSIS